jgi:hypothetical protein
MDYVDRYEGRTLWGQGADLKGKFGAARVTLRARPPGESMSFWLGCGREREVGRDERQCYLGKKLERKEPSLLQIRELIFPAFVW